MDHSGATLPHERKQLILDYLLENEVLSVEEAIRLLDVSPATVRRDFGVLSREKSLRRIRGGVAAAEPRKKSEIPPFSLRAVQHHPEKRAIAAAAAKLLRPDDAVIVEGGTTSSLLSEWMPSFPLRLITNSVRLAALLEEQHSQNKDLEVYVTGGILYAHTGLLLGRGAVSAVRQYHAQWLFLSIGGVSQDGISTINELVMEIERAMIESAEKVAVLADFSKLGKTALCHVCCLEEIDTLITNPCEEQRELLDHLRACGVEVIEATPRDSPA